jgi:hypothetical protein
VGVCDSGPRAAADSSRCSGRVPLFLWRPVVRAAVRGLGPHDPAILGHGASPTGGGDDFQWPLSLRALQGDCRKKEHGTAEGSLPGEVHQEICSSDPDRGAPTAWDRRRLLLPR